MVQTDPALLLNLLCVATGAQRPAPSDAVYARSTSMAWRVASGAAAQLVLPRPPGQKDLSQGAYLPTIKIKVLDKDGLPFYCEQSRAGGEAGGSRRRAGPSAAEPGTRPYAVLDVAGLDVKGGQYVDLEEDGVITIHDDRVRLALPV